MKLLLGLLLAGCAFGQVTFTRPVVRGTTVPMSCTITGQIFVDTDGTAGENAYICNGSTFDAYTGTGGGGGSDELGCTAGTSAPTTGTALTCYVRTDTTPLQFWVFVATDTPYLVGTIADVTIAGAVTLSEATANGSNFRRVTVPDALTADLTVRYPNAVPTANNVQCFPAPTANVSEFTWSTLDGCNGVVKGNLSTKFVVHDTGGDDTYSGNPIGGSGYCPAAYADGLTVEFVADTTNTGAATLDFCGLGALEITAALAGTDLSNGDIVVGKPYLLRYYDAATDLWIVTLPGAGSGGSPGGSGSEIQYRSGASTFGAVTGSSVSGADVTLDGYIEATPNQRVRLTEDGSARGTIQFKDASNNTVSMKAAVNGVDAADIWLTDSSAIANGVMVDVKGGVRLVPSITRRTCDSSTYRGMLWVQYNGAGVADDIAICLKGTAGTYSWVTIVTAP